MRGDDRHPASDQDRDRVSDSTRDDSRISASLGAFIYYVRRQLTTEVNSRLRRKLQVQRRGAGSEPWVSLPFLGVLMCLVGWGYE